MYSDWNELARMYIVPGTQSCPKCLRLSPSPPSFAASFAYIPLNIFHLLPIYIKINHQIKKKLKMIGI